jgi:hypothetical protein
MSYCVELDVATPDEEAASVAGVHLAPWVAAQASVIRARHIAQRMAETEEATRAMIWKRERREKIA